MTIFRYQALLCAYTGCSRSRHVLTLADDVSARETLSLTSTDERDVSLVSHRYSKFNGFDRLIEKLFPPYFSHIYSFAKLAFIIIPFNCSLPFICINLNTYIMMRVVREARDFWDTPYANMPCISVCTCTHDAIVLVAILAVRREFDSPCRQPTY